MKIKTVNRTIRPSSHKAENSYRVKIGKRNYYDKVVVNINHESNTFQATYEFDGKQVENYESIHFKANENKGNVSIDWVQKLEYQLL
jgi:hypothetical protein